jgi:hypothetical protein
VLTMCTVKFLIHFLKKIKLVFFLLTINNVTEQRMEEVVSIT